MMCCQGLVRGGTQLQISGHTAAWLALLGHCLVTGENIRLCESSMKLHLKISLSELMPLLFKEDFAQLMFLFMYIL